MRYGMLALWLGLFGGCSAACALEADTQDLFGPVKLVLEIDCSATPAADDFAELPQGVSRVESALGQPVRVLPNDGGEARYFAYRIGRNGLFKAGKPYVLEVEFPEDVSRSFNVLNGGAETRHGVATGQALADAMIGRCTATNPESLRYPLSGTFRKWRQYFFMHERFKDLNTPRRDESRPLDLQTGFWVVVCQLKTANAPLSKGAAVHAIRVYEVQDPEACRLEIRYPPTDLPRRHVFWREEMSDDVVGKGQRGVANDTDWYEYKLRLMQFLGINTFSKDLLEFGHNQGWDSSEFGGSRWVNESKWPQRWKNILALLRKYDVPVLPFYEYYGSVGQNSLGIQKRAKPLGGGKDYIHVSFCEKANADLTDPDTLEDAKKILTATIIRHRDQAKFLGAWFRSRPASNPIGFGESTRQRFAAETGEALPDLTQLRKDRDLRERYYDWWFGKRKQFLESLGEWLKQELRDPEAFLAYTTDTNEPGCDIGPYVVTDDPALWEETLQRVRPTITGDAQLVKKYQKRTPLAFERVVAENLHLKALQTPRSTWGKWEWQHACPQADPLRYKDAENSLLTYTFNRLYTVSSPNAFDVFRNNQGLMIVRHYMLNENEMHVNEQETVGYFVSDYERSGPHSVLAEARALAYGDPRYIGYLTSNNFARVFPEYVRRFNAAFLALPALPSQILAGASSQRAVVVRSIPTQKHGTYFAVINTGLSALAGVTVELPTARANAGKPGELLNAATGQTVQHVDGRLTVDLESGEVMALHAP